MRILTLLLLTFFVLNSSCKKDDLQAEVIGRWKLMEVREFAHDLRVTDYSENNVIYRFRANGTLSISSDVADIRGWGIGEYTYTFENEPVYDGMPETKILRIQGIYAEFSRSENGMRIDGSPLDGPILTFIRLPWTAPI